MPCTKACAKWFMLVFDTKIKYLSGLKSMAFDNSQAMYFMSSVFTVHWFC